MPKDGRWLICPCCGWNKKYVTERGIGALDKVPFGGAFIDHRDISGGRGSGFKRLSVQSIQEIIDDPEYYELLSGLKEQCKMLLEVLSDLE